MCMLNVTIGVKFLFIRIHEQAGLHVIFTTSK